MVRPWLFSKALCLVPLLPQLQLSQPALPVLLIQLLNLTPSLLLLISLPLLSSHSLTCPPLLLLFSLPLHPHLLFPLLPNQASLFPLLLLILTLSFLFISLLILPLPPLSSILLILLLHQSFSLISLSSIHDNLSHHPFIGILPGAPTKVFLTPQPLHFVPLPPSTSTFTSIIVTPLSPSSSILPITTLRPLPSLLPPSPSSLPPSLPHPAFLTFTLRQASSSYTADPTFSLTDPSASTSSHPSSFASQLSIASIFIGLVIL